MTVLPESLVDSSPKLRRAYDKEKKLVKKRSELHAAAVATEDQIKALKEDLIAKYAEFYAEEAEITPDTQKRFLIGRISVSRTSSVGARIYTASITPLIWRSKSNRAR
jgi:hypothetical protein